jgi:protein-disulfide isomerase
MGWRDEITTRRAIIGGSAVLFSGGGIAYAATNLGTDAAASADATDSADVSFYASDETAAFDIDLSGKPIMGSPDAPLTIFYWTDFLCPFCAKFEQETFPKLVENYVKPGDVRVVFIEFPNIGKQSMPTAVMSRCVWRQVREDRPSVYWDWHSAVMDAQGQEGTDWATRAKLTSLTRDIEGVDVGAVETCMQDRGAELKRELEANVEQARRLDVPGTPGFVIYNRESNDAGKLVGAYPYPEFEKSIERVRDA